MANESSNESISFPALLTIVFIVLKLIGIISWSWWWVLSPLWIFVAILLIVFLFDIITFHIKQNE